MKWLAFSVNTVCVWAYCIYAIDSVLGLRFIVLWKLILCIQVDFSILLPPQILILNEDVLNST